MYLRSKDNRKTNLRHLLIKVYQKKINNLLACIADVFFPFSRWGDQESEQAKNVWRRVLIFYIHTQFRSLCMPMQMIKTCYTGYSTTLYYRKRPCISRTFFTKLKPKIKGAAYLWIHVQLCFEF